MERETGIEPALVAWKATVLPLNYSRPGVLRCCNKSSKPTSFFCCQQRVNQIWWREVDYSGHPALRPSGASPTGCLNSLPANLSNLHFVFGGSHPPPNNCRPENQNWWREVDSNHRRHEPADLQSAPVGRLGIPPKFSKPQLNNCLRGGG